MLFLLIFSIVLGTVAANLTGIGFLFWVVAILVFICGLPGLLIIDFIDGFVDRAQDRADYRETLREIAEDERAYEHEMYEDVRMDRYLDKLDELHDLDDFEDDEPDIYIDNRQVHFHNHYTFDRQRDSKGRFVSKKGKENI